MADFLNLLNRKSRCYDASQSTVKIANFFVDGIVDATISSSDIARVESGVDPHYYTVVKQSPVFTLSITVLPLSNCVKTLDKLYQFSNQQNGYFRIEVVNNGKFVGLFDSHFLKLPDENISSQQSDKTYQFGMLPVDTQLFSQYFDDVPLSDIRSQA